MVKSTPTFQQRISITFSKELIDDIYFEMMKEHSKIDPKKSLGAYIEKKLRPMVPYRNSEIEED